MRSHTLILVAGLVAGLAACGGADDPTAAPTRTVTVTVTASPAEPPPADTSPTPSPTTTVGESPAATEPAAVSVCDEVESAGGEELAFVFVETPEPGAEVSPGFEVSGCANAFEATFEWELLDAEGNELASGFGTASCGSGCVGTFTFTVDYTVGELQVGSLRVFTSSPRDGSVQDLNVIPVRLAP